MKSHAKPKKPSSRTAKARRSGGVARARRPEARKASRKGTAVEDPWPAAAEELRNLRSSVEQTTEQVGLRLGAQISQLLAVLDNEPDGGVKPHRPSAKVAQKMAEQIRGVKLKPRKGRIKDLVRVQELLEKLGDLLPPQE
jgi:hypothetical protein